MHAPETVTTARLTLRRPGVADVEAVFAYARDPEVTRLLGWPRHETVADTHGFLLFSERTWARAWGPTSSSMPRARSSARPGWRSRRPTGPRPDTCSPARRGAGVTPPRWPRRWPRS